MAESADYDADALQALPVGTTIGGYGIRRIIGHGGFGITYAAYNGVTRKDVAIKEFFPSSMVRRDGNSRLIYSKVNAETIGWALRKFEETTTTLCGLKHPNIVQVHDYVPANDTGYMIMELLEGQTLDSWLEARRQPPSLDELRPVVDPIIEALGYVHGLGLIHRDIAPDNILITREGRPVLIDFGSVSRDLSDARQKAMSSTTGMAKRYYTAPEQARAKARPTPQADIYSMGAVLYRALSGDKPADGQDRSDAIHYAKGEDPYLPLTKRVPTGCTPRAAQAIDTALAFRPELRQQKIADLSAAMMPLNAAPVETPPPTKWLIAGVLAIALAALGGVLGGLHWATTDHGADKTTLDRERSEADLAKVEIDRQRTELADAKSKLAQEKHDLQAGQSQLVEQNEQLKAEQARLERERETDHRTQSDSDRLAEQLKESQAQLDAANRARDAAQSSAAQSETQARAAAAESESLRNQLRDANAQLASQQSTQPNGSPPDVAPPAGSRSLEVGPAKTLWDHNGSTVVLKSSGDRRQFFYQQPSVRIKALGVERGTLLFDGRRDGNLYTGTAYVFSTECGPAGYQVAGHIADDQRSVTLTGLAPHRDPSCKVTEHRSDILRFRYLEGQ